MSYVSMIIKKRTPFPRGLCEESRPEGVTTLSKAQVAKQRFHDKPT